MISQVICIALAIYFEARGEPDDGQIAVAHVSPTTESKTRATQTMRAMW